MHVPVQSISAGASGRPLARVGRVIGVYTIIAGILLPILWILLTSLKTPREVYTLQLWFTPTWDNFRTVFAPPWNLGDKLANSFWVALGTVLVAIPLAVAAAYAFSRLRFPGRQLLFVGIVASQFIPAAIVVLPYFLMFKQLGLLDTRSALVIVNLSIVLPYAIWMIKGFIDAVPIDIEESAMIDGASLPRIITTIVVPTALPGIITSAVFSFTLTWNEFIFALITSRQNAVTLPIALMGLRTERGDLWELMAAAGVIIALPMFLLSMLVQKQFIRSLTQGAVR
jgi:multiple sugar transport system permease protein